MTSGDYDFLSNFLQQSSGLALGAGKDYLLEARLVPLAQSWGLPDFDQLIKELRKGKDARLSAAVTEAMTTNETSFFRDKSPFEDLKNFILPALMEARGTSKKLRIWCAAASTGQEPYSVLMLLDEAFPQLSGWSIDFIATDISQAMLDRAREGEYSQFEIQRGLPIQSLVKNFTQTPRGWQVKEGLRKRVDYRKLNLLDEFGQLGQFDLIMCRNVLIYFDGPTKTDILNRMHRIVRKDGYLMLGAAETVLGLTDNFVRFKGSVSATYAPAGK